MGSTTDKIKGYANEAAGKVKQGVGKAVGALSIQYLGYIDAGDASGNSDLKDTTTQFDIQVSATVNGALMRRNQCSGPARNRALRSGFEIATSFGVCSPTVTWRVVTSA